MENLPKNLEKELGVRTQPKPTKKTRKWNLLIVGDHGKIIPVTRLKGLLITLVVVMITAVITTALFYVIYRKSVAKNRKLTSALEISKRNLSALQDEKDILMTRVVLAESRLKEIQGDQPPKATPTPPPAKADTAEAVRNVPESEKAAPPAEPVQQATPAAATQAAAAEAKTRDGVAVEEFSIFQETDTNKLKVEFVIKNTTSESDVVSGYAFVILKKNASDKSEWLVFPAAKMVSGKPALINKGQYFSISRFKSMKFEKDNTTDVSRLKNATVLVFNTSGELLIEKTFSVSVEKRTSAPPA